MTQPIKVLYAGFIISILISGVIATGIAVETVVPIELNQTGQIDNQIDRDALYHDSRDAFYRNPGYGTQRTGAVELGTDVLLKFRTTAGDVERVTLKLYDNVNNRDNEFSMSVAETSDGYDYWEYTVNSPGVPTDYYYAFRITDGTDTAWYVDDIVNSIFEDTRLYQTGGVGVVEPFFRGGHDWALVFFDGDFDTPDWHRKAVGYQIFIDRFFNGNVSNDPIGDGTGFGSDVIWNPWDSNGDGDADLPREGGIYVNKSEWYEEPQIFNYYGGDFQGIMQKIDYLNDLGIDFIWFNPFSESTDNHGYSVTDYRTLDSYYGILDGRRSYSVPDGDKVTRALNDPVKSMKFFDTFNHYLEDNGIKIIYDTVINHASAEGKYFQRFEGTSVFPDAQASGFDIPDFYPNIAGAFEDSRSSPYTDFFEFIDYNHEYNDWFGFDTIPTILFDKNGGDTGALEEFVTGPNNVFEFWINHGVDGFRLDVNDIYVDGDDSNTVNREIRKTVKANNPDAVIIGEIWARATQQLLGDQNDGTQNMLFRFNLLDWMRGNYNDELLVELFTAIQENYPRQAFESLWVNLGNHDRTRVLTVLEGNVERLKVASTIQFGYPGVPVVWYGDEIGTEGFGDPGTRQTFKWDRIEGSNTNTTALDLLDHYKSIIKAKKSMPVLQEGDFWMLNDASDGVISLYRTLDGAEFDNAVILGNRDGQAKRVVIDVSDTNLEDGDVLADILNGNSTVIVDGGQITYDIPAYGHSMFFTGITDEHITDGDTTNGSVVITVFPIFGISAFIMIAVRFKSKKS